MTRDPLKTYRNHWRFTQGSRMEIEQQFDVRYKIFLSSPLSRSYTTGLTQRPTNPARSFYQFFPQNKIRFFLTKLFPRKYFSTELYLKM